MSKFSFEKGQKIDLSDSKFHDDPVKNEILEIVIKKILKKHLKGGVTEDDLNRLYNSDNPMAMMEYLKLKEIYDKEREKFPEVKKKEVKVEEVKKPTFTDIIEEKEKEEVKLLKAKEEKLIELKKAIPPKTPKAVFDVAKKDVKDKEELLEEKRDELYDILETLRNVDDEGNYLVDGIDERRQLESDAYALRQQIDVIKDLLKLDKIRLKEIEEKDIRIEESARLIEEKIKSTQEKLKNKEELKQKLEEKTEKKRKQDLESQNQAKLVLKQKSLFPNIQKLRQEQQTLTKQKKKASRKK